MKYIIAKNAAPGFWDKHFTEDPGTTGLHYNYSAYNDKNLKPFVQPFYLTKEYDRAKADCARLMQRFPEDGYAIAHLVTSETIKGN